VGGGSAGQGWGFDRKVKIAVKFPRVGKIFCSNVPKKTHPGAEF